MKNLMILVALATVAGANAQVMLTSGSYSENFDSLVGATSPFSSTVGVQAAIPSTPGNGWVGAKIAGSGTSNMPWTVSDGSANSGGLYSYGQVGAAERALGTLASGSNTPAFGVELVNMTGFAITEITIRFTQENWRSSTSVANTINAQYRTGAAGSTTFLSDAMGFTDVDALDLAGPAAVASNGALNGNDAMNQAARSATILFSAPIAVGESFYLRFQDLNDGGNDAGLAIDDVSVQAVPEPATLAALGLGAAALLRRRNKKA